MFYKFYNYVFIYSLIGGLKNLKLHKANKSCFPETCVLADVNFYNILISKLII